MRQCAWCRLNQDDGQHWENSWVCYVCFPVDYRDRPEERDPVLKCDNCQKKRRQGRIILQRWLCNKCLPEEGSKKHKNKYAHLSNVDKNTSGHIEPFHPQSKKKPKRKEKKPKLKKIVYWKVVITDISTGDL